MEAKNNRFLIYLLVAIVAGFIFVCWLYLLPYIIKQNKNFKDNKNDFQKIHEEARGTLDEVREMIKNMGEKIEELKTATSTQAAEIKNQDINLLKEKILELNLKK
jgi:uncharacterized membrane-anchored protein YhcB (DUF1043 family)